MRIEEKFKNMYIHESGVIEKFVFGGCVGLLVEVYVAASAVAERVTNAIAEQKYQGKFRDVFVEDAE
jgi:hypothetical protein